MDYNKLFDLMYSTRISESIKEAVVNKIDQPIIESEEISPVVEAYIDLLDTLVISSASEALINDIIDETLKNVDEDFINEVSDEYIKRKAQAGLKQREKAYRDASSNVIGLGSTFSKAEKAGDRLKHAQNYEVPERKYNKPSSPNVNNSAINNNTNTTKVGVKDKLKNAVGKVKDWYKKATADKPIGLSQAQLVHAVGAKALDNEKKGVSNFKDMTKPALNASKSTETVVANKINKNAKTVEPATPEVSKEAPTVEATKKKTQGTKSRADKIQALKNSAKTVSKKTKTPEVNIEEPKKEKPVAPETPKKTEKIKATNNIKTETTSKKVEKPVEVNRTPETPKEEVKTSKKGVNVKNNKTTEVKTEEKVPEVKAGEQKSEVDKAPEIKAEVQEPKTDKLVSTQKTSKNTPKNGTKIETLKSASTEANKEEPKAEETKEEADEAPAKSKKIDFKGSNPASSGKKKTLEDEMKFTGKERTAEQQEKINNAKSKMENANRTESLKNSIKTYESEIEAYRGKPSTEAKIPEVQAKVEKLKEQLRQLEASSNDSKSTNEALSELAILLLNSNISESTFVEVMKMSNPIKESRKEKFNKILEKALIETK